MTQGPVASPQYVVSRVTEAGGRQVGGIHIWTKVIHSPQPLAHSLLARGSRTTPRPAATDTGNISKYTHLSESMLDFSAT